MLQPLNEQYMPIIPRSFLEADLYDMLADKYELLAAKETRALYLGDDLYKAAPVIARSGFIEIDDDYTVLSSDAIIYANATSGAITVTLPAAADCKGWKVTIKKVDSSANAVTLDADSSETIDGDTTYPLSSQYDFVTIHCDGAEWFVIGAT